MMGNPSGLFVLIFGLLAIACFALLFIPLGSILLGLFVDKRGAKRTDSGVSRFPTFRLGLCLPLKVITMIAIICFACLTWPILTSDQPMVGFAFTCIAASIASLVIFVPMLLKVGRLKSTFATRAVLATLLLELFVAIISPTVAYGVFALLDI